MNLQRMRRALPLTCLGAIAVSACLGGYPEDEVGEVGEQIIGVDQACQWASRQAFDPAVMAQIENQPFREDLICAKPPVAGQGDPPVRSSTIRSVECRYYCDKCRNPDITG